MDALSPINPEKIFVSFDGPRVDRPEDVNLINKCRELTANWLEQHRSVVENSEKTNLGCRDHVLKAISWFFEHVDEGIILEDDCIPTTSYFHYASELLPKYQKDNRILMISGNNYGKNNYCAPYSYSFTRYISIWGWATWKSQWDPFIEFTNWVKQASPDEWMLLEATIQTELMNASEGSHRFSVMKKSIEGTIDTWDYILSGYAIANGLKTIVPSVNLISNIGFDASSTHTHQQNSTLSKIANHELDFPLVHPPYPVSSFRYHHEYQPELREPTIGRLSRLKRILWA